MSKISPEQIQKVALLSRLSFTPEEADRFAGQLSAILDYAETLNRLDTSNVEPTSHSLPLTNVLRGDNPAKSLTPEEALANAPESESQCFKVPQIIQESS
jgi:aspartyl-tRNA(Asn)/glutamyl-tRNA(Gln) amidotransferase subunit C